MSGHSRWANIKHKKSAADKRRGKIFGKLNREIMVAARIGGSDPQYNPRLRAALDKAKAENMPAENIERAIKKGTGELVEEGYELQEVIYEGYGPGGIAIFVEAMTDNRNRTSPEIRHIFSRYGGNLGEAGCVAWMFQKKGFIQVFKKNVDENTLFEIALEYGADDIRDEGDSWGVYTEPEALYTVQQGFEQRSIPIENVEIIMFAQNSMTPDMDTALKVLKLIEALEDHDDVQKVWVNMELTDEILARVSAA